MAIERRVNDVHSRLNPTILTEILEPKTSGDLLRAIADGGPISISGCRHAMGGQQFVSNGRLIDMRSMKRVLDFDRDRGLLRVEAGIQWPDLIGGYLERQQDNGPQWGIAQKQTGADTFTIGGSLAANAHGRGLAMQPIVQDVECFTLLKADGSMVNCSRRENAELFSLVIGGYGLFGVVVDATLRLVPRQSIERVVEIVDAEGLDGRFEQRVADGFLYGDFQFSIDERSPDFFNGSGIRRVQPHDHRALCAAGKVGGFSRDGGRGVDCEQGAGDLRHSEGYQTG